MLREMKISDIDLADDILNTCNYNRVEELQ